MAPTIIPVPPRGSDVSGNQDVGTTGPFVSESCHQLQYISTPVRLQEKRCIDDAIALACTL